MDEHQIAAEVAVYINHSSVYSLRAHVFHNFFWPNLNGIQNLHNDIHSLWEGGTSSSGMMHEN